MQGNVLATFLEFFLSRKIFLFVKKSEKFRRSPKLLGKCKFVDSFVPIQVKQPEPTVVFSLIYRLTFQGLQV